MYPDLLILYTCVQVVSFPDPTLKEGKGSGVLGAICLVWPALGARANTTELKQTSDLIG